MARLGFSVALVGSGALWWLVPLCLDTEVDESGEKRQVKVLGYANAFGAPYLMFWSIGISVVFATTQLTGQLVLALATIALLAYLEVVDSVCDIRSIEAAFIAGTIQDTGASANQSPHPARRCDACGTARNTRVLRDGTSVDDLDDPV